MEGSTGDDTPSAAHRVFAVPELFERIVDYMYVTSNAPDPVLEHIKELFALQRVSRDFQSKITNSSRQRRKMLLDATVPEGGTEVYPGKTPKLFSRILRNQNQFWWSFKTPLVFEGAKEANLPDNDTFQLKFRLTTKDGPTRLALNHPSRKSSWRGMRLTHRPRPLELFVRVGDGYTEYVLFAKESNPTLGDVVDIMEHIACRHWTMHAKLKRAGKALESKAEDLLSRDKGFGGHILHPRQTLVKFELVRYILGFLMHHALLCVLRLLTLLMFMCLCVFVLSLGVSAFTYWLENMDIPEAGGCVAQFNKM